MNLLSRIRKSDACRIPVTFLILFLLILPPGLMPAQSPDWWQARGVLKADGSLADDFAAINQGQLKNLATAAVAELDSNFLVFGYGGAGQILRSLVGSWSTPTDLTDDYAPVTIGQLKAVAASFYDRLYSVGLVNNYPWENSSKPTDDYAIANIGQAKKLFSFAVHETSIRRLPPAWLQKYGLPATTAWDADPDHDWISNGGEYVLGTDPRDFYNGKSLTLAITGGGGQWGAAGTVLPNPLTVKINDFVTVNYDTLGAPLVFSVPIGGALLSEDAAGTGGWHNSLTLRTSLDTRDGVDVGIDARVFVKLPSTVGAISILRVSATSGGKVTAVETWGGVLDSNKLPPTGLTGVGTAPDSIELSWTPSDTTQPTTIEASTDGGVTWFRIGVTAAGVSSAIITGFSPGQSILYRVLTGGIATDSGNPPTFSVETSQTPPPSGPPVSAPATPVAIAPLGTPKLLSERQSSAGVKFGFPGFQNPKNHYLQKLTDITSTDTDGDGDGGNRTITETIDPTTGLKTVANAGNYRASYYPGVINVGSDTGASEFGTDQDDPSKETSTTIYTYSNPYTTTQLKNNVEGWMQPFQNVFSEDPANCTARIHLSDTEENYEVIKLRYKWQVNKNPNLVVKWFEAFTPDDGSAPVFEPKSWASHGATESPLFTIEPTQKNEGKNGVYGVLQIEIRITDRDDPKKKWADNVVKTAPVYSGKSTGDMVSWKLGGTDSWMNATFSWSAEGPETKTGPSGAGKNEWKIADGDDDTEHDWIDWKPGKYTVKCQIKFAGGNSSLVEFEQKVGVRSDDILVIGRIDPKKVSLDAEGVQPLLVTTLPLKGLENDTDLARATAGLLLDYISTSGVDTDFDAIPWYARGLVLASMNFSAFSYTDKQYALSWMFKYSGNKPPPDSFTDNVGFSPTILNEFVATQTKYKLLNHLQVKFLVSAIGNLEPNSIKYLTPKPSAFVGKTKDPVYGYKITSPQLNFGKWFKGYPANGEFPGKPGPSNGFDIEYSGGLFQENGGFPDAKGLAAFKHLTGYDQGEIWSTIHFYSAMNTYSLADTISSSTLASLTRAPKPKNFSDAKINTQVYPTYFMYKNGKKVSAQAQASTPFALFPNTDSSQ